MSEKNPVEKQEAMAEIDNMEIEPLSDELLDDVAGGSTGAGCSCSGCTVIVIKKDDED